MRAKAGDPPRTMVQKILAGRSSGTPSRGHVLVKADQAVLAKAPHSALDEAISRGLKKTPLEAGVVYETTCVRDAHAGMDADARHAVLSHGLSLARLIAPMTTENSTPMVSMSNGAPSFA